MILGWTGHRPDLFLDPAQAHAAVESLATSFAEARQFVTGGQRGIDMWAAQAAIRLGIRLRLVLPLPLDDFAADWQDEERRALTEIASAAAQLEVADGFSARNHLVATSVDLLVAVWAGIDGGGTAETIAFANEAATPIREVRLAASPAGVRQGQGI